MSKRIAFILFFTVAFCCVSKEATATIYLRPGDRGELSFTVVSSSDSVDLLNTPHVVYEDQPQWFSMGSLSILSHGPLAQGTSCELLIDYEIAETAPSGTSDLKFKVLFSNPNVYPPVWYPAANERIVLDGTAPLLSIIQPQWLGYSASTTVIPAEGISKIVRGPTVSFTALDAESDIADFQIYNSSGENLSAEYLSQASDGISYSGSFAEGQYNVTTLNKSGLSTTGKVYVDYTPVVSISTFSTTEISSGSFLDTFTLTAQSYWGLGLVKLLPSTFFLSDPLDTSAFDAANAVREFNGNGVSSATVVFQDVPDGEYVVYANNSLGSLSASPATIHSVTTTNPETGATEHSVQYINPDSAYADAGLVLNFNGKEKFTFHIDYASVTAPGLNFVNSVPVELPETISASYFTFPYGFGFTPKTSSVFSGDVSIRIDYRKEPFTQYQKDNARLYAYMEGLGWQNITSQTGDGWVTGGSSSLVKLALVFPYTATQPFVARSMNLIGTEAEAELSSYFSGVTLSAAATDQAPISDFVSSQEAGGKYLISNVFMFGGSSTELVPPGTLRFRYLATQLSRLGVSQNTLSVVCAVNGIPQSVSGAVIAGNDISALSDAVPQVCGLFSTTRPTTPDMIAPESSIQYDGLIYTTQDDKVYIGQYGNLRLYANDSAQAGVETSGVSAIYYGADLSSEAVAAAATGDFSSFIIYNSTFSLLEGTHTVTYFAVDNAGNIEPVKQAISNVDYSGPEVLLAPGDNQIIRNAILYVAGSSHILLNASDHAYDGVASGTSTIKALWDKTREDCSADTQYDPQQPWGTCANPIYHSQINVPAGAHSLSYWAEDNVGNIGDANLQSVFIDTVAPDTVMYVNGVSKYDYELVIPQGSSITLVAADPVVGGDASGVKHTAFLIDRNIADCVGTPTYAGPQGTCDNPVYTTPFTLSPGTHTISYFSQDNAGNSEWGRMIGINCSDDAIPPETTIALNGNVLSSSAPVAAVTTDTVTIGATDPIVNGMASGVRDIYLLIDIQDPDSCGEMGPVVSTAPLGSCQNYLYSGPFSLPSGAHVVHYTAVDNSGNMAEIKSAFFNVSDTAQTILPITPSSGPIGMPFTIEGAGFGAYVAGTTVVLIGDTTAPLTLWTDTKIQGTISGALTAGQYSVQVKRGAEVLAEVSPFTVTQPALYALTPSSGAIGLPFSITGESFGNYVAGYTRVLLGGATMPLTLWTDTKIQGTIPGTLPVGDYELVVERAFNGGVVRTSTATFSLRDVEAYWLAPSSGPIGMPFTITGVGFGNYSSVYTHVLIGDTTAPLTLWTDSKIQGTIPGSLISGQYPVLVERRTSDGGVMQTSPMTFEVVNVDVGSMTPVAGPIGMPFTIYGGNFGNYVANYTRVLIGGTTAPLTLWTADKIQGTIPGALGPGSYPVVVERELNGGIVQSPALAFAVSTPTAFNMAPSSGPIGLPFTINGESFGNYVAAYTGVLINGATVPLTLWTDTKIQGTIPGNLAPGQYPVMVGRMTADGGMVGSNALTFEVVGVNVASMTPVAGPIGLPFTIYGNNFGNYAVGYTKVLVGGTTCPLTLWTDTKIQGTVPGSLIAGNYQVIVERSLNGGQVQSVPVAFSVAVPEAYSLSPSSGPIGLPFTIIGANFGNYVSNYTKVLIGGAAAPLTLWTDTKIQGTIPGSLAAGDYELVVERALNGGVVRTSTFTFTVGTPYLDTVSPSTASVIAPFTITGYNFGNYVANYAKVLINGATTALTLWTDTKIQGKLPFLLAGTYPVQVQRYLNGGLAESATAYINVEEPVISSMTPTSGAVGTVFNLYGTGFGPYDATTAKTFIGGIQCALSLWTDTRITGTVPTGLSYGTHTVVASRGQALSNALEFYIPGGYSPSMIRPGLSPSALEFKLGEVYVYPDPAKDGKVPTFHIEVGTADSVKLKVYTVAGQLAHEQTLTGSPQAVGAVYAYEYAWTGRIASGVYYYTIEAERAGKKLKAKGRFAVVR